jgi:hypothetical protein
MKTITTLQAKKLINENLNTIFSVEFKKKNGDNRLMVARLGVRKNVKNIGLNFNPDDFNLITAFDMQKDNFRMINCNNLISLKLKGTKYKIEDLTHFCTDEEGNNTII